MPRERLQVHQWILDAKAIDGLPRTATLTTHGRSMPRWRLEMPEIALLEHVDGLRPEVDNLSDMD